MFKRLIYGLTGVTIAVAITLTSGPAMALTSGPPMALTNGPAMASATSSVSQNWAGYQARAADANYAGAQLLQPKITCPAHDSSSTAVIWVGVGGRLVLGGFLPGGKTLSQVGTYAFCYNGKARYFLWWETVGRSASEGGGDLQPVWSNTAPTGCSKLPLYQGNRLLAYWVDQKCTEPLAPGDRLNLVAQVSAGRWADLFAYDFRTKFGLNTVQTFTGAEADAANWIVEAPLLYGEDTLPLANFGEVALTNCQVVSNNKFLPISSLSNTRMYMISDRVLPIRASAGALTAKGTQFSVTWKHR